MAIENPEFDKSLVGRNMIVLGRNPYPGRGIVLGRSTDGEAVQVYWVMGRSENSRNRILIPGSADTVRTEAYDESKVEDPNLIIYNAMRTVRKAFNEGDAHVVSNGDQTDSVWGRMARPYLVDNNAVIAFQNALLRREFEPDEPNYTARVTGMIAVGNVAPYAYSIIRRNPASGTSEHTFGSGSLLDIPKGFGLCFHTYEDDGEPLPTFEGSPYAVSLDGSASETAEVYWDLLDKENRVGIAVKTIDLDSDQVDIAIKNQLGN